MKHWIMLMFFLVTLVNAEADASPKAVAEPEAKADYPIGHGGGLYSNFGYGLGHSIGHGTLGTGYGEGHGLGYSHGGRIGGIGTIEGHGFGGIGYGNVNSIGDHGHGVGYPHGQSFGYSLVYVPILSFPGINHGVLTIEHEVLGLGKLEHGDFGYGASRQGDFGRSAIANTGYIPQDISVGGYGRQGILNAGQSRSRESTGYDGKVKVATYPVQLHPGHETVESRTYPIRGYQTRVHKEIHPVIKGYRTEVHKKVHPPAHGYKTEVHKEVHPVTHKVHKPVHHAPALHGYEANKSDVTYKTKDYESSSEKHDR